MPWSIADRPIDVWDGWERVWAKRGIHYSLIDQSGCYEFYYPVSVIVDSQLVYFRSLKCNHYNKLKQIFSLIFTKIMCFARPYPSRPPTHQ